MSLDRALAAAREVRRRQRKSDFAGPIGPSIAFRKQADYIDATGFIALLGSRRMGKTSGHARKLLRNHLKPPFTTQYFIGPSLKRAKEIVWAELKTLNTVHALGGVPNETTGAMRFPRLPGEPEIRLGGVNNKDDIDKIRGDIQAPKLIIVDECQSIPDRTLRPLVNDAAEPALSDYGGTLAMSGTPGAVCAGYWYDITDGNERKGWNQHRWTLLDNTFLHAKRGLSGPDILAAVLKRRQITEDDPTYQREFLGRWVNDPNALVWKYDRARNGYKREDLPTLDHWGMAFDLGFEDADAWGRHGWKTHDRRVWSTDEHTARKQAITPLGKALNAMYRDRPHQYLVGDLGALGKKIGEELTLRWQLPVEAADKHRKAEHIELLNDALLTGLFMIEEGSVAEEDARYVQWDADAKAKGELKISNEYHSDIWDKELYGFRKATAFLQKPAPDPVDEPDAAKAERKRRNQRQQGGDPRGLHGRGGRRSELV